MTDRFDYAEMRAEAHELIDLAALLLPEGEGLDLSDRDHDLEYLAHLKTVLASMRSAIDGVSHAIAVEWDRLDPKYKTVIGNIQYGVGYNTKKVWAHGDSEAFAKWLKDQDIDVIAATLPSAPTYGLRVSKLNQLGVTDTFIVAEKTNDQLTIKTRKVD